MQASTAHPRLLSALLLGFCAFAVWTTADATIRYLRVYPPEQVSFLAALYSQIFMFCFASYFGGFRASIAKPKKGLQILRGLVIAIASVATFFAFMHLPLVNAFAIIFLSPLAAKILSLIVNREKVPPLAWLISLVGFCGVLLVVRPGFQDVGIGEFAALCVPLTFALGFILARTIGEDNQTPLSSVMYVNAGVMLFMIFPAYTKFVAMEPAHFVMTLYIAFAGTLGTCLATMAFARAPAAYISPLHYTQIVWGVLWGILFFNEYPDAWTLAGAAVIIGAGLMLVWMSRRA